MPDLNALILAVGLAFEDELFHGPDDGRREALERAQAELWWARMAERYAGWTGSENLLVQGDPAGARHV